MANYQNQYAATPQIVDPTYPLSQADEAPQHYVADDQGKTQVKGLDKGEATRSSQRRTICITAASSGEEHLHEKKGIMDKVKEKLPGLRH